MSSNLPYSTLKNVTSVVPATNDNCIVGRYLTYPDITGRRKAQGGLRLNRKFKCSLPDIPLISIITVCLNSEKTLEQCIHSVLQQTYSNIEYIIIDGSSTDRTVELIEKYEDVVDYFLSEPDRGLYHAMNKGLELATGDYVLILNSDDWYEKDCVESLVKAKKYAGTNFVSALAQYVDQAGKPVQVQRSMPYNASLRLRMPLRHETMLLSADIYNTIGIFDESFRIIADFHLTIRLFENGYTHYQIPRALMLFRNTGVSSTNLDKLFVERERLIRRQFPFLEPGEEKLFGNISQLTPWDLENIARKYSHEIQFIRTLECYFEDRKGQSNLAPWKDYEINWKVITKTLSQLGKSNIKVATLCSMDHGGAGTGTQRRVEALRSNGLDARIYSLVVKSKHPYVERVVPQLPSVDTTQDMLVWRAVRERAILPVKQVPGFCATELFSLTDSVVDFRRMSKCFDDFDVIHFHWVVGMFDFKHAAECLAKKPLIWTLADMNAFTGGCHYSEGCEEYTKQCRACPLLGGTSDLAHETWKIKNEVYQQLENMHIVCPSRWMAERVAKSSLLGGKKIHYIPNPYPTERLRLTNKVLARIHLGLPVNKKLLLFGADSLGSYRKGSDLLRKSIDAFAQKKRGMRVEVIVFGNDSIKLPLPVHSLGYISDDEKLALAYSAADAFLFPSREDNAPLTIGESLLCGTPVVAFPVGHVPDIVKHGVTGYIAKYLDANDFATGIEWALNCAKNDEIKREITCRLSACGFHDPLKSVKRHLAVYHMAMHNSTKSNFTFSQ